MPRLTRSVPAYRKHRASGQAIVTLSGRDFYLGPHGTKASRIEYDRLVQEWLVNGRQLPTDNQCTVTVVELAAAFLTHAKKHYVKRGRLTNEFKAMKTVLRYLKQWYGTTDVADFRPLCMEALRQKMIEAGNSRGYINQNISRIRHIFKWGVSKELVPESVHRALTTMAGLQAGKSDAVERPPVLPVTDDVVDATLPHLSEQVAALVRLQRLCGMRPMEVVLLRPCDIDRTHDVWRFIPCESKMEHKGRKRIIYLGPQAQAILLPYLLRDAQQFCFAPKRSLAGRFTTITYRDAVHRGCEAAKIEKWNVNQLRHTAATRIRETFGIEAAQHTLGHAKPDMTLVYAESSERVAADVARKLG